MSAIRGSRPAAALGALLIAVLTPLFDRPPSPVPASAPVALRPDYADNPFLYRPQLYQVAVARLAASRWWLGICRCATRSVQPRWPAAGWAGWRCSAY